MSREGQLFDEEFSGYEWSKDQTFCADGYPIADVIRVYKARGADWLCCEVQCPFKECGRVHTHGYPAGRRRMELGGHRTAHCGDKASSVSRSGYIVGKWAGEMP